MYKSDKTSFRSVGLHNKVRFTSKGIIICRLERVFKLVGLSNDKISREERESTFPTLNNLKMLKRVNVCAA